MFKRLVIPMAFLAAATLPWSPVVGQSHRAGTVRFFVSARSDFEPWIGRPTEEQKAWMRAHYARMIAYSPYFDSRLAWYPLAWAYRDAYAIYPDSDLAREHPEWILRDENGERLFIPYGCSGGACPQYAADVGDPGFRRYWIDRLKRTMQRGYLGVYIDDVNLDWRISDGNGDRVVPIDVRTGRPMELSDWRRYFAEFMELVRAELPGIEIVHNSIWYAEPLDDPFIERQIAAADYIGLERGVSDRGIVGGAGRYGFRTFLEFIDRAHALGAHIILDDDDSTTERERDYELAFYFLINDGGDLIGADGDRDRMSPDSFWEGYRLRLGAPLGAREEGPSGLHRREFECGRTLLNDPGGRHRVVDLESGFHTVAGQPVGRIELDPSSGVVLIRSGCERAETPPPE
jgi:hypothetical protein